MNKNIITFESVTYAIKARKILSRANISSKLIKTDSLSLSAGCTHGLEISASSFLDAVKLLRDNNIEYSVFDIRRQR